MNKLGFYFTLFAGVTGLLLIFPKTLLSWSVYSTILTAHILANFLLVILTVFILITHVRMKMKKSQSSPRGKNGLFYLTVIILSLITGILLIYRSGYAFAWLLPVHLVVGFWSIYFSIQHVKGLLVLKSRN